MSFRERVLQSISQPRPKDTSQGDALTTAMYVIMRRLKGYTHFDFMRDDFKASQFFALMDLISVELEEERKAYEDAKKKQKKR